MNLREGFAGWLLKLWRNRTYTHGKNRPRLELLERITLAPRQSLALVEAEGRRFLVATSLDGGPAFHALDDSGLKVEQPVSIRGSRPSRRGLKHGSARASARTSW